MSAGETSEQSSGASTICPICPFTLQPISAASQDSLAVVYQSNPFAGQGNNNQTGCGHWCNLAQLVPYLHDNGGCGSCPSCQTKVAVVCDALSDLFLRRHRAEDGIKNNAKTGDVANGDGNDVNENEEKNISDGRIISFRYASISYYLWITSNPIVGKKTNATANDNAIHRIAVTLGMDVKTGLKVIYKGKVIYPDNKSEISLSDSSEQVLDVSFSDLLYQRKKPSLVVMGLRQQALDSRENDKIDSKSRRCFNGLLLSLLNKLSLSGLLGRVKWGLQWFVNMSIALVRGVCLFIRSILYPPRAAVNN